MTNWMTAAGLALIAGGLATLISFRSLLFGGGARRAGRRQGRALEAPRRRPALPATASKDPAEGSRRGRRRASSDHELAPAQRESDEDERGGLASIGFAEEEEPDAYVESPVEEEPEREEPEPVPARGERYGDRVEGWVRPEYRDPPEEPRPGEYWTPIPVDLAGDAEPSAKGYGWPRPVERLPAVPDYEPATGFDLIPIVSEPTEVVPSWPLNDERPGRIRLPRSWASRDEKPFGATRNEKPSGSTRNEKPSGSTRNEKPSWVTHDEKPESAPPAEPRRRPRPRPRPRPEPDRSTTVYVSRHAADPPPRPGG